MVGSLRNHIYELVFDRNQTIKVWPRRTLNNVVTHYQMSQPVLSRVSFPLPLEVLRAHYGSNNWGFRHTYGWEEKYVAERVRAWTHLLDPRVKVLRKVLLTKSAATTHERLSFEARLCADGTIDMEWTMPLFSQTEMVQGKFMVDQFKLWQFWCPCRIRAVIDFPGETPDDDNRLLKLVSACLDTVVYWDLTPYTAAAKCCEHCGARKAPEDCMMRVYPARPETSDVSASKQGLS